MKIIAVLKMAENVTSVANDVLNIDFKGNLKYGLFMEGSIGYKWKSSLFIPVGGYHLLFPFWN